MGEVKLRVRAVPKDGFGGRHRAGRYFPAGQWVEGEFTAAEAAAVRADPRLLVEEEAPTAPPPPAPTEDTGGKKGKG